MNPEIDNILARYFSGEANDKDMAVLDTWLAESEANEQVFEQMTLLFEKAAPFSTSQQPNTGKALQLFKEYMQQPEKNTRRFTLRNYLYWSAAAVLVMAVTLTVFHLQPNETTIQVAATATTETIILPDSSIVTIAPGSRISYNKDFGVQERRVQLTGKATFDVGTHGAGQFTVMAGDLTIQDVGTIFTVDAYAENDHVDIAVETGAVVFTSPKNTRKTELYAGETGSYHKTSGSIETVQEKIPEPLIFDAATLQEVITVLSQRYSTPIHLTDASLAQRRINVRFEDEDIHTILTIISETLSLTLTRENDRYILSPR